MTTIAEILADRLRSLRKDRGWTQETLAENADLSLQTVQLLESQKVWISKDTLKSLAKGLDVTETVLFQDPGAVPRPSIKDALSVIADACGLELPEDAIRKAKVKAAPKAPSPLLPADLTAILESLNHAQTTDLFSLIRAWADTNGITPAGHPEQKRKKTTR